jgi:hypothetical protein
MAQSFSTTTPSINPSITPTSIRHCCTDDMNDINTAAGTYTFTNFDVWHSQASALGAKEIYTISRYPSWSNGGAGTGIPPTDISTSATCPAPIASTTTTDCTIKAFVSKLMQHVCGVSAPPVSPLVGTCNLEAVEIANEFNGDGFWTGN